MCSSNAAESISSRARSDWRISVSWSLTPMATPGNGEICPGRKHQMNIGRKKIGEPTQIGDEDGVRKVVEIVKDDHHLGQLGQLCLESFEQWRTEPTSVQRRQGGEIGEVRVDAASPESNRWENLTGIIVVDTDFHPDEGQLGMASGPLGEEHRLSRSGRSDDECEGADKRFVQPASEGRTVNCRGRCDRWWSHDEPVLPPWTPQLCHSDCDVGNPNCGCRIPPGPGVGAYMEGVVAGFPSPSSHSNQDIWVSHDIRHDEGQGKK